MQCRSRMQWFLLFVVDVVCNCCSCGRVIVVLSILYHIEQWLWLLEWYGDGLLSSWFWCCYGGSVNNGGGTTAGNSINTLTTVDDNETKSYRWTTVLPVVVTPIVLLFFLFYIPVYMVYTKVMLRRRPSLADPATRCAVCTNFNIRVNDSFAHRWRHQMNFLALRTLALESIGYNR